MDKKYGESLDDWNSKYPEPDYSNPDEWQPTLYNPKKFIKENTNNHFPKTDIANVIYWEASRLNTQKRYSEALVLINISIENDDTVPEYFNMKGVILENLHRFKESYDAYLKAVDESDEVNENMARMLYRWANSLNDKKKALGLIEQAILILPESKTDEYFEKFWYLKGSILDCLGKPLESRKCYMMAEGMVDEIRKLDEQADLLNNSKDTLINITGTRFYHGMEPFTKGLVVDLVREDENEHDEDAIRVELEGETLGYVANNEYTLIENVKSATEIRKLNYNKAEVMMIYLDEYVIAKLIG